jgi:hypothetical protein
MALWIVGGVDGPIIVDVLYDWELQKLRLRALTGRTIPQTR